MAKNSGTDKIGLPPSGLAVLTAEEMQKAEKKAFEAEPSYAFMKRAGKAVSEALKAKMEKGRVLVLCGPGNNGGDGWIAARLLKEAGFEVTCCSLKPPKTLKGDAKKAFGDAGLDPASFPENCSQYNVIIDALFGTGLSRNIEGNAVDWIDKANGADVFRVALDIPSGIHSDTGQVMGTAFKAHLTVTFFHKKRGHMLDPGLSHAGEVVVDDIGIAEQTLEGLECRIFENSPVIWRKRLPHPDKASFKQKRGHTLVFGGEAEMSGAARMAALAALRTGSGLVTSFVPENAKLAYAQKQTSVMSAAWKHDDDVKSALRSSRYNTVVIGPGNGVNTQTRKNVLAVLKRGLPAVLDADAISVFEKHRDAFLNALHEKVILTPHIGEFQRIWPDLDPKKEKLEAARKAAKSAGCIVLLKGADTVIAAPGGVAVINIHATPYMATAGAGDVLAGMIAGLLAQGMFPFDAACAAAWMHGDAGLRKGPGLIADDLIAGIPDVLKTLLK